MRPSYWTLHRPVPHQEACQIVLLPNVGLWYPDQRLLSERCWPVTDQTHKSDGFINPVILKDFPVIDFSAEFLARRTRLMFLMSTCCSRGESLVPGGGPA